MKFAKIIFYIAAIWGILILTPLYFMFDLIGRQDPPPITHPGFYYAFVSVGLAWQIAFFIIARDPVRFRPLMIAAILEKFGYGGALYRPLSAEPFNQGRFGSGMYRLVLRNFVRDRVRQTPSMNAPWLFENIINPLWAD